MLFLSDSYRVADMPVRGVGVHDGISGKNIIIIRDMSV
jgi:hypothetical protein